MTVHTKYEEKTKKQPAANKIYSPKEKKDPETIITTTVKPKPTKFVV